MTPARTNTSVNDANVLDLTIAPVRKSVQVHANIDLAFEVFTAEFDSWWPRSHHIGTSPLKRSVIEQHIGGRCYAEQEDGTTCDWGQILAWDPPMSFVLAWQITPDWQYQPDLAKSSEVEVRFTSLGRDQTRVDLEHRHFERHGEGGQAMRAGVDTENGWNTLLQIYATQAATRATEAK